MQFKMEMIWTKIAIILVAFFLGYAFKSLLAAKNSKPDGQIILDHNDNGDDRIQFVLGLEYEDFKNHKVIIFDVINKEEK